MLSMQGSTNGFKYDVLRQSKGMSLTQLGGAEGSPSLAASNHAKGVAGGTRDKRCWLCAPR
jgi:hypothetical protein